MLTSDDRPTFRGASIEDAQIRERNGRQVLRLRLANGGIVAIEGDGLNVADESSIEWTNPY
jgi:hypothetical protein